MAEPTVVDVRGEFCPRPIIETAKAIKTVAIGDEVRILATDRGVHSDMPAWCKATGQELVALEDQDDGLIEVRVRRRR